MLKLTLAVPLLLSLVLIACGDSDDDAAPTATSPSGAATAVATTPPIDGTVAPQNAGSTDAVTIKSNPDPAPDVATLTDVRVGAHPENGGWDRIVFEFDGILPPGQVLYVDEVVQCGSGDVVNLPGEATLEVRFTGAHAHNDAGQATIDSQRISGPGNIILESRQTCDFEAHVNWDIGTKSKKPFKVTMLSNPTRVVIDVKQ